MNDQLSDSGFVLPAPLRYNAPGLPPRWGRRSEARGSAGPPQLRRDFSMHLRGVLTAISRLSGKRGFMRTRPAVVLLLAVLVAATAGGPLRAASFSAQDPAPQDQNQPQYPDQAPPPDQGPEQVAYQNFSPDQLDNLLAPIALYPDPLLAQVLVAATFPDQIDEAARFLRAGANPDAIDSQPWDVSVKSIAHYPTVLYMMDNRLDWTTSVGQAYVNQSTDVQASIQHLRQMAHDAGTLVSSPQMEVVQQGPYWDIWPVQPQFIYVPVYNPVFVFYGRPGWHGPFITFGVGFPIGAWLALDFDWGGRGIYYFGWGGLLSPWAIRSRPYVHITNVYVNNRYRTVTVNRGVLQRSVNYENLNRYNGVHSGVNYSNLQQRNVSAAGARPGARPGTAPNQLVQRNINTGDARIQDFRGREGGGSSMTMEGQGRPAPQRPTQAPAAQARPAERPSAPSAFNPERGTFDAQQASQRGQASRQQASRPAPAARPAPAPRPSGGGRKP